MLSAEVFLKREVLLKKELVVCRPIQVFLVRGGEVERYYSRIVLWGLTSAMGPAILRNTELVEPCMITDDGCESAFRM